MATVGRLLNNMRRKLAAIYLRFKTHTHFASPYQNPSPQPQFNGGYGAPPPQYGYQQGPPPGKQIDGKKAWSLGQYTNPLACLVGPGYNYNTPPPGNFPPGVPPPQQAPYGQIPQAPHLQGSGPPQQPGKIFELYERRWQD